MSDRVFVGFLATGVVLAGVAVVAALEGADQALDSIGMDQGSPAPAGPIRLAVAGIVAAALVAIGRAVLGRGLGAPFVALLVLVVVLCSVPIWRRDDTIDVTDVGFRRAGYDFDSRDFRVYNGTGAPIRVCLGAGGRCAPDAKGAGRLRAPGLTVGPGDAARVGWPAGTTGRFTLTVADPPSAMTRPGTRLRIRTPPRSEPGYDPPYQPPPPPPPPPPIQPPLR